MGIIVCALVSYTLSIGGEPVTLPPDKELTYGVDQNTVVQIDVPETGKGMSFYDKKSLKNGTAFITVWRENPLRGNPAQGRLFVLRNDGHTKDLEEAYTLVNKNGGIFAMHIARRCQDG